MSDSATATAGTMRAPAAATHGRGDIGRIALAHLGLGLVLVSLFTWIEPVSHPRHSAIAGVPMLLVGLVVVGFAVATSASQDAVLRGLRGALGFGAAAYVAGAAGIWADAAGTHGALTTAIGGLVAIVVAGAFQLRRAATGTVLALGLGAVAVAVGLVGDRTDADHASFGAALFIVSAVFAILTLTGWLRPAAPAAVVMVTTGLLGTGVVLAGPIDDGPRILVVAMLLIVLAATMPVRVPTVVFVVALGASLVVAGLALQWKAEHWYADGAAVGGLLAFLMAAGAERHARHGLRIGASAAFAALLVLFGGGDLGVQQSVAQDILGAVALLVLAAVAARTHRPLVAALAVVELISLAPSRFAMSSAGSRHSQEAVFIVLGALLVIVATRMSSRPSASAPPPHLD